MHGKPGLRVAQVQPEQFLGADDPRGDGVAVKAERLSGRGDPRLVIEVGGERFDELGSARDQRGEQGFGSRDERVALGPREQQLLQAERIDPYEVAGRGASGGDASGVRGAAWLWPVLQSNS